MFLRKDDGVIACAIEAAGAKINGMHTYTMYSREVPAAKAQQREAEDLLVVDLRALLLCSVVDGKPPESR
jgi:acyl CoA:acetate/3-ketoacid CoA transferase alpha subunit